MQSKYAGFLGNRWPSPLTGPNRNKSYTESLQESVQHKYIQKKSSTRGLGGYWTIVPRRGDVTSRWRRSGTWREKNSRCQLRPRIQSRDPLPALLNASPHLFGDAPSPISRENEVLHNSLTNGLISLKQIRINSRSHVICELGRTPLDAQNRSYGKRISLNIPTVFVQFMYLDEDKFSSKKRQFSNKSMTQLQKTLMSIICKALGSSLQLKLAAELRGPSNIPLLPEVIGAIQHCSAATGLEKTNRRLFNFEVVPAGRFKNAIHVTSVER